MKVLDTSIVVELEEKKIRGGSDIDHTLIEVLKGVKAEKRSEVKKLLEETFKVLTLHNKVIETYCNLYGELKEEGEKYPMQTYS